MVHRRSLVALTLAAGLVTVGSSRAAYAGDDVDGFAAALKDATGEYTASYVLTKLNTFKLGKKCWAKLTGKDADAVHSASFATRDIAAFAKDLTGEDWSAIESQNNSDRETNKALVEPKIAAFKAHYTMAVTVDGDDCDAKSGSLWLRYWSALATNVRKYPPPGGKAFITLDVSSSTKAVTVDVSKDGSTFTIKAPKDIEDKAGYEKLERPFRKLNSEITDDFAFATKEATGRFYSAWVLTKLHTFKLGKKCQAKLADPGAGAVHAATFATRDLVEYAKANGAEDWDAIETQSANDPKTNQGLVAKDMEAFKGRLGLTISVEGEDCDVQQNSLWLRYWTTIATALRDNPPKAKKVAITLNVSAKAKDVTSTVGKDGATFTFTAPRDKEVPAWDDKLTAPFKKVAKKK